MGVLLNFSETKSVGHLFLIQLSFACKTKSRCHLANFFLSFSVHHMAKFGIRSIHAASFVREITIQAGVSSCKFG